MLIVSCKIRKQCNSRQQQYLAGRSQMSLNAGHLEIILWKLHTNNEFEVSYLLCKYKAVLCKKQIMGHCRNWVVGECVDS